MIIREATCASRILRLLRTRAPRPCLPNYSKQDPRQSSSVDFAGAW